MGRHDISDACTMHLEIYSVHPQFDCLYDSDVSISKAKYLSAELRGSPQMRELNRGLHSQSKVIICEVRRDNLQAVRAST